MKIGIKIIFKYAKNNAFLYLIGKTFVYFFGYKFPLSNLHIRAFGVTSKRKVVILMDIVEFIRDDSSITYMPKKFDFRHPPPRMNLLKCSDNNCCREKRGTSFKFLTENGLPPWF